MEHAETMEERTVRIGDVERELLPAFVRSAEVPPLPGAFVRATVRLVALVCSQGDAMCVRFEALDPDALIEELQGPKPRGRLEPFVRDFLCVASAFYRWLGERGVVPAARAGEVASALDARRAE